MATPRSVDTVGDQSERWAAYTSAILRIEAPTGPILVSPRADARANGQYPDPTGRPIFVVTAWNPRGQVQDSEANLAAQARLEAELRARQIDWWPAVGGDTTWTHEEVSVAIVDISEAEALKIGLSYGQDAIFVLTPTALHVLDCASGERLSAGWSIQDHR